MQRQEFPIRVRYRINTCYTSIGHSDYGIDASVKSELEGGAKTLSLPLPWLEHVPNRLDQVETIGDIATVFVSKAFLLMKKRQKQSGGKKRCKLRFL